MRRRPPRSTLTDTLFPYPTLFRSLRRAEGGISPSYPRGRAGPVRGGGKAAERRRRPLYAPRVQPAKKSGKGGRQGREEDQAQGLSAAVDRNSVLQGHGVYIRVDLGGRRVINKKTSNQTRNKT